MSRRLSVISLCKRKKIKNGCGFYVISEIKLKSRKDLDMSYLDENNEFQSWWIRFYTKNNQLS